MNYHTPHRFSFEPSGPFELSNQNAHFGGWPTLSEDPGTIVMAFPVEGSERSAAVELRQGAGLVKGEVHGCRAALAERAWRQALQAISLDVDGSGWAQVGSRDPVIGRLQGKYRYLRPALFHSPYEAAAAFVIGHRISIKQTRALRARIAAEHGTAITVGGEHFEAFPTPGQLLAAESLPVNATKAERLRAIAGAAQDGWLERGHLRSMPDEAALTLLRTLPGIGAFFAQGILYRGAGAADALTDDEITKHAVRSAYALDASADQDTVRAIAERWRPYRMWVAVLLHVWARSELGLPRRRRDREGRSRAGNSRQAAVDRGAPGASRRGRSRV